MLLDGERKAIAEGKGAMLNDYNRVVKLQLGRVLMVAHIVLQKTEVFFPESSIRHGSHLTQIERRKSYSGTLPVKAVTGMVKENLE